MPQREPDWNKLGQLALMDWGLGKYRVDVDYMKVDTVNVAAAGPDKGVQVPYQLPIPDPETFVHAIKVAQDCMIHTQYPDMNFNHSRSGLVAT